MLKFAKYCPCPEGYKKRTAAEAFEDFQKRDYYESANEYVPSICILRNEWDEPQLWRHFWYPLDRYWVLHNVQYDIFQSHQYTGRFNRNGFKGFKNIFCIECHRFLHEIQENLVVCQPQQKATTLE
uniref:Uncharacterized protein n=1 Tax=Romanomermis culicivorax TaxID=13658 RepID=A0A915K4K9_ROMCU